MGRLLNACQWGKSLDSRAAVTTTRLGRPHQMCYATGPGQLPRDSHLRGRKSRSILTQAAKLIKFPAADLSHKAGLPGLLYRPRRERDTVSIVSMGLVWTADLEKEYFPEGVVFSHPCCKACANWSTAPHCNSLLIILHFSKDNTKKKHLNSKDGEPGPYSTQFLLQCMPQSVYFFVVVAIHSAVLSSWQKAD